MSLLFNKLSRLVITFLPKRKPCFPIYLPWSDGTGCHDLISWMLNFKPTFSFSALSLSSRGSLVLLCFLPWGWCHLHIWGYWYFSQQSWFQLVLHSAQPFTQCTLHISLISRVTIYSLMHSFPNFEPVCCSMFSSNCCFLTCTLVSQEAGKPVLYSHFFKYFPQFFVIHTVKGFT